MEKRKRLGPKSKKRRHRRNPAAITPRPFRTVDDPFRPVDSDIVGPILDAAGGIFLALLELVIPPPVAADLRGTFDRAAGNRPKQTKQIDPPTVKTLHKRPDGSYGE